MSTDFFNSKLFAIFSFCTDVLLLNVCWIALSLPIVTAGASTAALYYCVNQMRRGKLYRTIPTFWKAFCGNIKKGTVLLLFSALLLALAAVDVILIFAVLGNGQVLLTILMLLPFILTLPSLCYLFPLQGNYDNTIKNTISLAWKMSVVHPVTTILVVAINLLPVAAGLIWAEHLMIVLMLFTAFGGFLPAYLSMLLLSKVFDQYED